MSAVRRLVHALSRLLPREIADAAAGDLEEQWRRDARQSRARAAARLAAEIPALLWCALRSRDVVSTFGRDLRYGVRLACRQPKAALLSLLTLALGLGAATALFALTNAWLLRPLPFPDADRLVAVWETVPSQDVFENTPAPAVLFEWRARARDFDALGAMTTAVATMTGAGDPERLAVLRVDEEMARVVGLRAAAGRLMSVSNGAPAEAMLSDAFWHRRFGGSPAVIGSSLTLDGQPVVVAGVLPADLSLLGLGADVWRPLRFTAAERESRSRYLWVIGRLRHGIAVARASDEVNAVSMSREPGLGARAVPLQEQTVGSLGHDLPVLLGATGVLLLIACANVAGLALARASVRRREFAVRAALGASRGRIAMQMIAEAMPVAFVGGIAGLVMSGWLVRAFVAWLPQREALAPVPLADPRVFAFGLAASVLSALCFGSVPAAAGASRRNAGAAGDDTRVQSASPAPLRMLAAVEIALSVALVIAAALVSRSFIRLSRVDLGFTPNGVVTFELPRRPGSESHAFFTEMLRRLETSPGIAGAGLTQALPLKSFGFGSNFPAEGVPPANRLTLWRIVSPQYFDTLKIPMVEGRAFDGRDASGAPRVAIVSESYAKATWPGQRAIGRRIGWATLERPMTVVGVVRDIRLTASAPIVPHVYMPFTQVDEFQPSQLAVRTGASVAEAVEAVRRAVWAIDPSQPIAGIQTMDALAWRTLARRRFQLALWISFAAVAAVLSLVGIYGVVSFAVRRSVKELGIRLALGARSAPLAARLVAQALAIAAAGTTAGMLIAYWTAETVRGFLVGIEPREPIVYAAVAAGVLLATAAAAAIPAHRVTRIDPLEAIATDSHG